MRPPSRPRRGAAILAEGPRELHRKQRMTNKRQSKVDEGWLLTRESQFCAPTNPPPQRRDLPLGLWGGGGRIQSGAERKGRGCDYHDVDNDNDDNGKGGKQRKKY
jgi:hypothetical protein